MRAPSRKEVSPETDGTDAAGGSEKELLDHQHGPRDATGGSKRW